MIHHKTRKLAVERRDKILREADYSCAYCQDYAGEVDHIVPWSYIHDDSVVNLVACCKLCNMAASNKVFDSFTLKQTYLLEVRKKWLERPIPVWTVDEFEELDPDFQAKLISGIVIIEQSRKPEFLALLKSKGFRYFA